VGSATYALRLLNEQGFKNGMNGQDRIVSAVASEALMADICWRIQPVDATLLLLAQSLVCCIHRLNPPVLTGPRMRFPS